MTIDELRKRKRELAVKKYELECQPPDERDALALAIISEEFWDVLEQLKAIAPPSQPRKRKTTVTPGFDFVLNRQQFLKWQAEEQSLDEVIAQGHAELRDETARALDRLPPRQREVLELKLAGRSAGENAQALGIARSTFYNRTYIAQKNVRIEAEKALAINRLLDGKRILDLTDANVMETVLRAMTPSQAAYFYLYYSEGLSGPKIEKLFGPRRSSTAAEVSRALKNVDILLKGQDVHLQHPEALDKLGYMAYCELCDHPEIARIISPSPKPCDCRDQRDPTPPRRRPYKCTIHVRISRRRVPPDAPPGKLRAALMERGEDMIPALATVFSICQAGRGGTNDH